MDCPSPCPSAANLNPKNTYALHWWKKVKKDRKDLRSWGQIMRKENSSCLCTCICISKCISIIMTTCRFSSLQYHEYIHVLLLPQFVFVLLKNTHKKLCIQGNLRRSKSFWTITTGFECITAPLSSISNMKYIRQTRNLVVLCTILRNITTHQTQYVTDLETVSFPYFATAATKDEC